jgi:hypothetical protein
MYYRGQRCVGPEPASVERARASPHDVQHSLAGRKEFTPEK